jgi:hypothetical protein
MPLKSGTVSSVATRFRIVSQNRLRIRIADQISLRLSVTAVEAIWGRAPKPQFNEVGEEY